MLAVGADAREGIHRFLGQRLVEAFLHQLGVAEDGGERGSQLVAHVGDELRLVLAGDLKLAALLGDLLEQAGVLERDRRLVGEGLHEADDGLAGTRPAAAAAGRARRADPRLPSSGTMSDARRPASSAASRKGLLGRLVRSGICSGCRLAIASPRPVSPAADVELAEPCNDLLVEPRGLAELERADLLAIVEDRAAIGARELDRAVDDGLEHDLRDRASSSPRGRLRPSAVRSRLRACTSSNSRVFSMAITAWSAKVSTSSICLSVNGSTSCRADANHADADRPRAASGRRAAVRKPAEHLRCDRV